MAIEAWEEEGQTSWRWPEVQLGACLAGPSSVEGPTSPREGEAGLPRDTPGLLWSMHQLKSVKHLVALGEEGIWA